MHVAQIGTGRVGRPTAYTIACSNIADKITVCDTQPGLADAFAEELKHVTVSIQNGVQINSCENSCDVKDADIILISAGKPRTPGVKMTRRDLAIQNGRIVKQITQSTVKNNPDAKYVVITNPVDAMAMVCKKFSQAEFVISTGTNLETLRFKTGLAKALNVPTSVIEGWVGGEHGQNAAILWSTIKIDGLPLEPYLESTGKSLFKEEIADYVKSVSKRIVDNIGGTEYGPAVAFRDIVRAIINNTQEVLPVAAPQQFDGMTEQVFVSVPLKLGESIGDSIYGTLTAKEQKEIKEAAEAIQQTFNTTI